MAVVEGFRKHLENETRVLRHHLRDAEAWHAKMELDAILSHEVEAAAALLDFWERQWAAHRDLCDWFAGFAAKVMAAEVAAARELGGMTV